jgi:hypothetical protein
MSVQAKDILSALRDVTNPWAKQRKAEERNNRPRSSRSYMFSPKLCHTDVAHQILPPAYVFASGGGRYTVGKRHLWYGCREEFKERTRKPLGYHYFAQNLLRQYMNTHPETESWKVTADPRGTLILPNTAKPVHIPVGTLHIEGHLRDAFRQINPYDFDDVHADVPWPSLAPGLRYRGVLYIEKEGFDPMLREAKIAERFNIAILSCKGQSVVAARRFVDFVCAVNGGVPLGVVHDFDKSGFEIAARLTTVSEWAEENNRVAYEFQNEIDVTDLGLRLEDVRRYGLEARAERVHFKGQFAYDSLASPEEQAFLRSGRRVELNAFSAPDFIAWLEEKLAFWLGKEPFIPDDDQVLELAFRRALAVARVNKAIRKAVPEATDQAKKATVPDDFRAKLREEIRESKQPWDQAMYDLAQHELGDDGDEDE